MIVKARLLKMRISRLGDNLKLELGLSLGLVFIAAGLGGVLWL